MTLRKREYIKESAGSKNDWGIRRPTSINGAIASLFATCANNILRGVPAKAAMKVDRMCNGEAGVSMRLDGRGLKGETTSFNVTIDFDTQSIGARATVVCHVGDRSMKRTFSTGAIRRITGLSQDISKYIEAVYMGKD